MYTLLNELRPGLEQQYIDRCLHYRDNDEHGNIILDLTRESTDEDFTDTTEQAIERQRLERAIAQQEREERRLRTLALLNKEDNNNDSNDEEESMD